MLISTNIVQLLGKNGNKSLGFFSRAIPLCHHGFHWFIIVLSRYKTSMPCSDVLQLYSKIGRPRFYPSFYNISLDFQLLQLQLQLHITLYLYWNYNINIKKVKKRYIYTEQLKVTMVYSLCMEAKTIAKLSS